VGPVEHAGGWSRDAGTLVVDSNTPSSSSGKSCASRPGSRPFHACSDVADKPLIDQAAKRFDCIALHRIPATPQASFVLAVESDVLTTDTALSRTEVQGRVSRNTCRVLRQLRSSWMLLLGETGDPRRAMMSVLSQ
jgi:hypothetical protein